MASSNSNRPVRPIQQHFDRNTPRYGKGQTEERKLIFLPTLPQSSTLTYQSQAPLQQQQQLSLEVEPSTSKSKDTQKTATRRPRRRIKITRNPSTDEQQHVRPSVEGRPTTATTNDTPSALPFPLPIPNPPSAETSKPVHIQANPPLPPHQYKRVTNDDLIKEKMFPASGKEISDVTTSTGVNIYDIGKRILAAAVENRVNVRNPMASSLSTSIQSAGESSNKRQFMNNLQGTNVAVEDNRNYDSHVELLGQQPQHQQIGFTKSFQPHQPANFHLDSPSTPGMHIIVPAPASLPPSSSHLQHELLNGVLRSRLLAAPGATQPPPTITLPENAITLPAAPFGVRRLAVPVSSEQLLHNVSSNIVKRTISQSSNNTTTENEVTVIDLTAGVRTSEIPISSFSEDRRLQDIRSGEVLNISQYSTTPAMKMQTSPPVDLALLLQENEEHYRYNYVAHQGNDHHICDHQTVGSGTLGEDNNDVKEKAIEMETPFEAAVILDSGPIKLEDFLNTKEVSEEGGIECEENPVVLTPPDRNRVSDVINAGEHCSKNSEDNSGTALGKASSDTETRGNISNHKKTSESDSGSTPIFATVGKKRRKPEMTRGTRVTRQSAAASAATGANITRRSVNTDKCRTTRSTSAAQLNPVRDLPVNDKEQEKLRMQDFLNDCVAHATKTSENPVYNDHDKLSSKAVGNTRSISDVEDIKTGQSSGSVDEEAMSYEKGRGRKSESSRSGREIGISHEFRVNNRGRGRGRGRPSLNQRTKTNTRIRNAKEVVRKVQIKAENGNIKTEKPIDNNMESKCKGRKRASLEIDARLFGESADLTSLPAYTKEEKDRLYGDNRFVLEVKKLKEDPSDLFVWQITNDISGCYLRQFYPAKFGGRQFFIKSPVTWRFLDGEFTSDLFHSHFQPVEVIDAQTNTPVATSDSVSTEAGTPHETEIIQLCYIDKPFFNRMIKQLGSIYRTEHLRNAYMASLPLCGFLALLPNFLVLSETHSYYRSAKFITFIEAWKELAEYVEKVCEECQNNSNFTPITLEHLRNYPDLVYIVKGVDKGKPCSACQVSGQIPEVQPFFRVRVNRPMPYNRQTMVELSADDMPKMSDEAIYWCRNCSISAKKLHRMFHILYSLLRVIKYNMLKDISMFQEAGTQTSDAILLWILNQEKSWSNNMFLDFQVSVAEVEAEFLLKDTPQIHEQETANASPTVNQQTERFVSMKSPV